MPSTDDTSLLHSELLNILQIFDKICVENDIKYSLHGGTLLGAIREKGFIPWDDDVDVSMTRDNYEKLLYCIKNKNVLDENTSMNELSGGPTMLWLKRPGHIQVWIDIFIYDGISSNTIFQKLKFMGLCFFLGFCKNKTRFDISKKGKYTGFKFWVISLLYHLGELFDSQTKHNWRNSFAQNWFCGNGSLMVRSNDQYEALGLYIKRDSITQYTRVPFENVTAMVHLGYDEILKSSYGNDYMIPKKMSACEIFGHESLRNS